MSVKSSSIALKLAFPASVFLVHIVVKWSVIGIPVVRPENAADLLVHP